MPADLSAEALAEVEALAKAGSTLFKTSVLGILVATLLFGGTSDAVAQVYVGSGGPRRGAVEISGGGMWNAGQDLASRDAVLTGNPGAGLGTVDLFRSEPSLDPVIGAQALVGVYVTRALAIEGGVQFSRPTLSVRLGDDFEDAPDVTATTDITQYLFTGSVLYHIGRPGRVAPFMAAGAGHLRDVHFGNELVETGTEYHGKLGVKIWTGEGRRRFGIRAEGGLSVRNGGFNFDEDRRVVPTAAVSLAYLF
ncbi:MAG: outer membrane beta-barrel protein [Vicinamibacterales bacterium]